MIAEILIAGVFWAGCSFAAWGLLLGWWTEEFPSQTNYEAGIFCIFGPFSLLVGVLLSLLIHHKLAWRIIPLSTEQRWQHFHRLYPNLSREWFK